jgi:HSP20 family protein
MAKENGGKAAIERKKGPEAMTWPEEMERFLDHATRGFGDWPWGPMMHRRFLPVVPRMERWVPEVDIVEEEGRIVVKADLPGMKREDIEVAVEGDMLAIRGHRKEEKEVKEENYYRAERATGEFYRAFTLPEGVDPDAVEATYTDGVLEIRLPRPVKPEAKKLKVDVK